MGIIGIGQETYLYINGLACTREIQLDENSKLIPVNTPFNFETASKLVKNDIDFSIVVLSAVSISSVLQIKAADEKELAISAWNSQWNCILLSAILNSEIMCNLQSDKSVDNITESSYLNVTNYGFHGLLKSIYTLSDDDEKWIDKYYSQAMNLMQFDSYMNAVHALASYRWHSMPRVQLAIIWSGIESLFNVSTEVSFRVSLYIAFFLSNQDKKKAKEIYSETKKIYNSRSAAVHGNKMKDNIDSVVIQSANLLNMIIKHCAEIGSLPETDNLLFM